MFQLAEPDSCVEQNINVEAAEISEMAKPEVAIDATLFRFAERHQIGRIQLEIGMQMERASVMHFQLLGAAAHLADRMQCEMLFAHSRPVTRARSSDRMLAFRSIHEVFDDWHRRKRKKPPEGGLLRREKRGTLGLLYASRWRSTRESPA